MGGYSCHQIGLGYNNIVADDMRMHGGNNHHPKSLMIEQIVIYRFDWGGK